MAPESGPNEGDFAGGRGSTWEAARRGVKMSERLARQIFDDVMDAGLSTGNKLPPEASMIANYGVGRATLREALRLLEVQGLIVVRPGPGGGPVVSAMSARDFATNMTLHLRFLEATYEDVVGARLAIEPLMARLASVEQHRDGLDQLEKALELGDTCTLDDDRSFYEATNAFHVAVAGISGNPVLDLLGRALKEIYDRLAGRALTPVPEREKLIELHRRIGAAILEGRADEADELMRSHMEAFAQRTRERYPGSLSQVIGWD